MANPCQPCTCVPHEDICCCPPQNGISVIQPACQTLADGSIVQNPCFNPNTNRSVWTYKFIVDCAETTDPITNIAIPICSRLNQSQIVAEEQVDGCGSFTSVPFSLAVTDPAFGTAPEGFQFLIIAVGDRYANGLSVTYRLTIDGDFPLAAQPIQVGTGEGVITFSCDPETCFIVPACPPVGNLVLTKVCNDNIIDNAATIEIVDTIANAGNATVENVAYNNQITYDATKITIGPVIVTPVTLTVNTSVPGIITISGNLGNLESGDSTNVNVIVPIASVSAPGTYPITSSSSASGTATQSSANCTLDLEVVQLRTNNCCSISDLNTGSFTITVTSVGNSPQTTIEIRDTLVIPAGITVQFTSFGGCTATFTDGTLVPLNTNLTNRLINISCTPVNVPAGGSFNATFTFKVVSVVAFGIVPIINTFEKINFINLIPQLNLGVGTLPVSADINMVTTLECNKPCSI